MTTKQSDKLTALTENIRELAANMCFCKRTKCSRCGFLEDVQCNNENIRNDIFMAITAYEQEQEQYHADYKSRIDKLLKLQIEECRIYAQRCARDSGSANMEYDKWISETPLFNWMSNEQSQSESIKDEGSIVRNNLMNEQGYAPYCGNDKCSMPRTKFNGEQFVCPECGWVSKFQKDFIDRYKAKWRIEQSQSDKPERGEEQKTDSIEAALLDIAIDIEEELLRQMERAGLDDYQSDMIKENIGSVFDLNKQKYIRRLLSVSALKDARIRELEAENKALKAQLMSNSTVTNK